MLPLYPKSSQGPLVEQVPHTKTPAEVFAPGTLPGTARRREGVPCNQGIEATI